MIKTQPVYNPLYLNKDKFIIILSGGRGSGKCLKKGTKVIMHDLTLKPIEEIQIGEKVMGDDFTPNSNQY